ncbi:MAG: PilZ domain-containing protein [Phycisphaerales bacterium]|nr:MAG: PilZ domain-containing protein [Phycisphaerales bacterium]
MDGPEKRRYRRLAVSFGLSWCKTGRGKGESYTGRTVNVSPGGLYFETSAETLKPGNVLDVRLSVPPTTGQLELGGRLSGFGRVLRVEERPVGDRGRDSSGMLYGVALEFFQAPRLRT